MQLLLSHSFSAVGNALRDWSFEKSSDGHSSVTEEVQHQLSHSYSAVGNALRDWSCSASYNSVTEGEQRLTALVIWLKEMHSVSGATAFHRCHHVKFYSHGANAQYSSGSERQV